MGYSVGIVAIARNEGNYINEWIEYHHALGFEHLYIYDNSFGKEPRLSTFVTEENKKVSSIIPAYNRRAFQKQAYGLAYSRFGPKHDYLLFIDIDEFFTLNQHKDVSDYIQFLNVRCPGFQNARIHWEVYDDNNAIERDMSIPVHKFFTHLAGTREAIEHNNVTKSLVKTQMSGVYFPSVHYPQTRISVPLIVCDSTGREIHPSGQLIKPRDVSIAKIRHYVTKTISEYMYQKLCRGDADGYIIRDIWNRFFNYCAETSEKMKYYNNHKDDVYVGKYSGVEQQVRRGFRKDRIVVSMTSWIRRINNCRTVLDSVLKQTMKPNIVFLNLSLEEFPNREQSLPSDLVQLAKTHPEIKINWLGGNTKSFKKLFPILPYLEDNDIIMIIDDDFILYEYTIQSRYRDFVSSGKNFVIVSDWMDSGLTMMFQKKMLNGYETFFVPEVINTGNDDAVYFNIFHLNGYKVKKGSSAYLSGSDRFIEDEHGLTYNHQYFQPEEVTPVMKKIMGPQFKGMDWKNLFGVFRYGSDSFSGNVCDQENSEGELERTFNQSVEDFFYGDSLRQIKDGKTVLFVGSDIPNQIGKDVLCCGLGWKYLPGQKHKEFRQFVPPANFLYFRGEISKKQVELEGVNLRKDIPVGDTRLLSSLVFRDLKQEKPSMDVGIVVASGGNLSPSQCVSLAKGRFPKKEIGTIETGSCGFEELSEFVTQCGIVISDSLWGIAIAHSFGVPVVCFLGQSGFELMDYYSVFKRVRYRDLSRKISFNTAMEHASDQKFLRDVNPTRTEVEEVQRKILSAFPHRELMVNGCV